MWLAPLFAQTEQVGKPPLLDLLPIVLIFVVFWLFMLRPARKEQQERQKMIDGLKKNDKVHTSGGLVGTVTAINEKDGTVALRVDDASNVRLHVLRNSITRVFPAGSTEAAKDG